MLLKSIFKYLFLLSTVLIISAACNRNDTPNPGEITPATTVAQILQRGHIIAGVKHDFPPFGSLNENGEAVGFDVDIVREFARRWLGDANAVELVRVTSDDRISRLEAGEFDLAAASMTHTQERDETIDFSQTYFLDGQSLLVQNNSNIQSLADLHNKRIAAISGSTSIDQIESEANKLRTSIEIVPVDEAAQAVSALLNGTVDAFTTDSVALNQIATENPGLIVVGGRFTQEPYGIGLPQGDSAFRELVNYTLQEMKRDGTYDELYQKWFPNDTPFAIELLPGIPVFTDLADFPTAFSQQRQATVQSILSRGHLIAGVKYDTAPFGFLDRDNNPIGFDIDIVREFAQRWLGDADAVEFVRVTSDDRIPRLTAGEFDLLVASMTHKHERDETIDFSQTYFLDGQSLLVQSDSDIRSLMDLGGRRVGAVQGSTSLNQITTETQAVGLSIEIVPFDEPQQAVAALLRGDIDVFTNDSTILLQFALENVELEVVGERFTSEPYGIGVPQGDSAFRELVDFTLQAMKQDGTYDRIYQKWFPSDAPYNVEVLPGCASHLGIEIVCRAASPAEVPSTFHRIDERGGVLLAGVKFDFAPLGYLDDAGELQGFDVDLIRAMSEIWGVEVEFVQVTSNDRIPKLAAQEIDIVAASMTHTKDREETIDFSQTYFVDGQSLLVHIESGIEGFADLGGKRVAALTGSTSIEQIKAYADANRVAMEIVPFQGKTEAFNALQAGAVDALTTDRVALSQLALTDESFIVVGNNLTVEPYAFGLPPGDSFFNNLVNYTLQDLKQNGTYDRLYRKHFGSTPYDIELIPGEWPETFDSSPPFLELPAESQVERILADGRFVAGVKYDFPPFGFIDETGSVVGFDVDIMREFAKRWLGDANAVDLVQVTSSDRISKLAAGQVDILAASMTHTQERDVTIDFSQTYFIDGQSLLVARASGINDIADLDGKVVAAVQGSTSIVNIENLAIAEGIDIEISPFQGHQEALTALETGQVDALTTDNGRLQYAAQQNSALTVVGGIFTHEPYGLGLPNYDARFQDLVNFTLQEMQVDGTYDRLYEKWFGVRPSEIGAPTIEVWPGQSYLDINTVPMLRIPAGEFIRGSDTGPTNEAPESTIFLDEFYIDQYEVTNRLYAECVQAEVCTPPKIGRSLSNVDYFASSAFQNYPVIWVTWDDAATFCTFAGKRLPTEAEWEKAARGPHGVTFPWGGDAPTERHANFIEAGFNDARPVGSFPQGVSFYGVHDMAGNVREWVADWYQRDYYATAVAQNPMGPASGVTRVGRGGGWIDIAEGLSVTLRKDFLQDAETYDGFLGFRCASTTFPPQS